MAYAVIWTEENIMITIKDISNYTGIPVGTIANVLHGRTNSIPAETIEQVNAAIRILSFSPLRPARAIDSYSSRIIAFINHVITAPKTNVYADPFHSIVIGTIEAALRESGYYFMLRTVESAAELDEFLCDWNVEGIFLIGTPEGDLMESLMANAIPSVLIDSYAAYGNSCSVGLEDYRGTYLAARRLICAGHTHICYATPPLEKAGVLKERYNGYLGAMHDAGLATGSAALFEYEMNSCSSIRECAEAIAAAGTYTAVVASADQMAIGLISCLEKLGIRCPEDFSIVGFDDLPQAELCVPSLTTVHQDIKRKASVAAEIMLQLLNGSMPEKRQIVLPVSLTERSSVRTLL